MARAQGVRADSFTNFTPSINAADEILRPDRVGFVKKQQVDEIERHDPGYDESEGNHELFKPTHSSILS
jgi:hypothetical protein